MAMDFIGLSVGMGYTDETVIGGGALKGKNCVVSNIEEVADGVNVTFQWTLDNGTVQTETVLLPKGTQGETGVAGKSAYDTWLGLGNTGTEEDFLISLVGEKGADGKSAYQYAQDGGYIGTETEFTTNIARSGVISKELEVERARIDNLTTLQDGSTTGDAELVDARVDNKGKVWANVGKNLRNIGSELERTKQINLKSSSYINFDSVNKQIKIPNSGNMILFLDNVYVVSQTVFDVIENDIVYIYFDRATNTFCQDGEYSNALPCLGFYRFDSESGIFNQIYMNANVEYRINNLNPPMFHEHNRTPYIDPYNSKFVLPSANTIFCENGYSLLNTENEINLQSGMLYCDLNKGYTYTRNQYSYPYLYYNLLNGRKEHLDKINMFGNEFIAFGDSIVAGAHVKDANGNGIYMGIVNQLASMCDCTPINKAQGGMGFVNASSGTSQKLFDVLSATPYTNTYKYGLLICGTNDFGLAHPLGDDETEGSYTYEVDRCLKYIADTFWEIPFLICSPVQRLAKTNSLQLTLNDYANVIKAKCEKYNLMYCDLTNDKNADMTGYGYEKYFADSTHINLFGHIRIANILSKFFPKF